MLANMVFLWCIFYDNLVIHQIGGKLAKYSQILPISIVFIDKQPVGISLPSYRGRGCGIE